MAILAVVVSDASPLFANSLQIQPTIYRDISLAKGEKKKGFVDVSNPSASPQIVTMTVQGFRQIDDSGSLTFFDDQQIAAGLLLDLDEFELGPREAARVYFLINGTNLPTGDVFASIFASNKPAEVAAGSAQAVRVGTLFVISNGTPASHEAEVAALSASPIQIGNRISATIDVKNTANEGAATGFFPKITVATKPYGEKTVDAPLLFAGRTRTVDYSVPGNYFGPILVSAKVGTSEKTSLIFAITGYWRWLSFVVLAALIAAVLILQIRKLRRLSSQP
jgi:hypothetical protein